ncbi:MAG: hypothetical protein E6G38_08675 [Actinobacteria bacterium]|nr:MAG: hypothetical protein E6G38_08675 [Actinomycetota bacterium]
MLERSLAVHLGDDERDPVLKAVGRRLVDRDRAAANGVGYELAARSRADREQAEIKVSERALAKARTFR